jgi:hypothetical protein
MTTSGKEVITLDAYGSDKANIQGRVGLRHTFPSKTTGRSMHHRYATKARDESHDRDNPGNGQVFDPAMRTTSRSQASPHRDIQSLPLIPDLPLPERAVEPSG